MTQATDIPNDLAAPIRAADAALSPGERLAAVYELTKPRMNFLVVITTAVGFYVAAGPAGITAAPLLLIHAIFGTALTAAGASVLNQWWERDIDAKMPRTRQRPLVTGKLTPGSALLLGILFGATGTAWLAAFVNVLTAGLGLATLLLYMLVYTPLKSRSSWSTLVGAVPGAIPPMMGTAAVENTISPAGWALFAILFVWQMPHFFGLAIMFKNDYARGGLKMLPTLPNGERRTHVQIVVFNVLMIGAALLPTLLGVAGLAYAVVAVGLSIWYLLAGVSAARLKTRVAARRLFVVSILYLPALLAMLMLNLQ